MKVKLVVKSCIDIPINCSLFKEETETVSNVIVPVFLQYFIYSLMHQKVWFSRKILTEIHGILTYRKTSKGDRLSVSPPPPPPPPPPQLAVSRVSHSIFSRTPIDTLGRRIYVRKAFILFYMINYHEVIPFMVYITVSHSRGCKFYNSY